jgi:hypothetical protein
MPTITSTTADSYVQNDTTDGDWDDAQGSATTDGGLQHSGRPNYTYGVYTGSFGSRGSNDYKCYRSYFVFDVSGESGAVGSATISIYLDNLGSTTNDSEKAILVEATALDDGVEDHGNVFSSGTTWHDDISDVVSVSTTAGSHTFTMNSDGIALIQSKVGSGSVTVGLVGWYNDYMENVPSGGGEYSRFSVTYREGLGTVSDPKMDITYTAVTADNATFFGANF